MAHTWLFFFFSLQGDPLLDSSTKTLIPTFTAPLTRVVADVVFLENIATAKAAIEAKAGLETGRRIGLVSFAPLGSSFVAASVAPFLPFSCRLSLFAAEHCSFFPGDSKRSVFNPPESIIPAIYTRCLAALRVEGNTKTDAEIFGEVGLRPWYCDWIGRRPDYLMYDLVLLDRRAERRDRARHRRKRRP